MAKKERPVVSEYNSVPLYRAYGVTKKENIFTVLNEVLAIVMGWLLYILFFAIIIIGTVFMIKLLGSIGILCVFFSIFMLVYFVLARKIRKRAKIILKLKKKCRQLGYALELKRGFFKGLKFNKEGIDFVVHTPTKKWAVRFMTPKKRKCHITFLDKNTIEIKKIKGTVRLRNGIFGYNSLKIKPDKITHENYSYDDVITFNNVPVQKILLVNPVPLDMFKRDSGGSYIPIDTGERLFDYMLCSGTGFLNTLEREHDKI